MKHTNNQSNDFKILDQLHLTALNMSTIDGYRRVFEYFHPNHEWTLLILTVHQPNSIYFPNLLWIFAVGVLISRDNCFRYSKKKYSYLIKFQHTLFENRYVSRFEILWRNEM